MRNHVPDGQFKRADVVIVGAGVIGLSIARSLAQKGLHRIIVVERTSPGAEASCAAGGMLAPQSEADCADDFFHLACKSRDMYPEFAAALRDESGIDIELDPTGTLYVAFSEHDQQEIENRFHWQTAAGLDVEQLSTAEIQTLEPAISSSARAALRFPLDTQVENRKLVKALTRSVELSGAQILNGVTVQSLLIGSSGIEGVHTSSGRIDASLVVVANGAWVNLLTADAPLMPRILIEPVRGQMLCFEADPPIVRHVVYSPRGYLVPRHDGRLLAGSTTEHAGFDKSMTTSGVDSITAHAVEIAPAVGELPLVDSWAGLRPRAADNLPVIGMSCGVRNLYFAGGHYRNGILLTPITGELVAEEICTGLPSPLLGSFRPDRFAVAARI
jgi:glycine oxidase